MTAMYRGKSTRNTRPLHIVDLKRSTSLSPRIRTFRRARRSPCTMASIVSTIRLTRLRCGPPRDLLALSPQFSTPRRIPRGLGHRDAIRWGVERRTSKSLRLAVPASSQLFEVLPAFELQPASVPFSRIRGLDDSVSVLEVRSGATVHSRALRRRDRQADSADTK